MTVCIWVVCVAIICSPHRFAVKESNKSGDQIELLAIILSEINHNFLENQRIFVWKMIIFFPNAIENDIFFLISSHIVHFAKSCI